MAKERPKTTSCKDSDFGASPTKHLRLNSSHVASTLAVAAGVIFALASCATNLLYGLAKGTDLPTSVVWGSVAVAASIGLALAPSALLASLSARRYAASLVALAAMLIFGAYSVTAALGSASGGRMAAQNQADDVADKRARYQSAHDAASVELGQLASARPSQELKAEIAAIDHLPGIMIEGVPCGGVLNGKVTKQWCPKRSELAAEDARAERREKLQAEMSKATAALTKLPAVKVANSDAQALAGYLAAVGISVSTDTLNQLLVVMAVLVIEFGGGLSLALAMSLRGTETGHATASRIAQKPDSAHRDTPAQPQTQVSAPASPTNTAGLASSRTPTSKPKRTPRNNKNGRSGGGSGGQRLGTNVVELLKQRGGKLEGGQRALGRLLGVSKSRMNEVLHELHHAGLAVVSATKFGTKVELAAA